MKFCHVCDFMTEPDVKFNFECGECGTIYQCEYCENQDCKEFPIKTNSYKKNGLVYHKNTCSSCEEYNKKKGENNDKGK